MEYGMFCMLTYIKKFFKVSVSALQNRKVAGSILDVVIAIFH